MNILIAGIYRSGSTWLFNAVRLLCIESGLNTQGLFIWWTKDVECECHVIKTHATYTDKEMEAEGFKPDFVITSTRDKEDIINSMKNQRKIGLENEFNNAGNYEDIETFISWLQYWGHHEKHVYQMDYEDLKNKRIMKILTGLNQALSLNLNTEQLRNVERQLDELVPPKQGLNKITLLTSTHYKK